MFLNSVTSDGHQKEVSVRFSFNFVVLSTVCIFMISSMASLKLVTMEKHYALI